MAASLENAHRDWLNPLASLSLAGAFFFFLATWLSDWAYASTYEIQWNNFASWLLVGALVLAAVPLVVALLELRAPIRRTHAMLRVLALGSGWLLGLLDSLIHARDAWASMPYGLVLSVLATLCIGAAVFLEFFTAQAGGEP